MNRKTWRVVGPLLGWGTLLWAMVACMGGWSSLWAYSQSPFHKLAARRLLAGEFFLVDNVRVWVGHDTQVFNGATFTNFGYGVPLLQAPFHWAMELVSGELFHFFPDRFIFFLYLALTVALLYYAFQRQVCTQWADGPAWWRALAPVALGLAYLAYALSDLLSYRFIVYEETVAYLVLCQLVALAAYLRYRDSRRPGWVTLGAVAAGLSPCIRATGLFLMLTWAAVFFLAHRDRRVATRFAAVVSPFLVFWAYGNWIRTGSVLSPGYRNSLPYFPHEYPATRFADSCSSTWPRAWETLLALTSALFVQEPARSPWLQECHLALENSILLKPPYLGILTLPLGSALAIFFLRRCRQRWEVFVPYLTSAMLLAGFTFAGIGLAYRYAGDFSGLVLLTATHGLIFLPRVRRPAVLGGILVGLVAFGAWRIGWRALPQTPSIAALPAAHWRDIADGFRSIPDGKTERFPESIACADASPDVFSHRVGWKADCSVDISTNLFLGLPDDSASEFELWAEVEGDPGSDLHAYINGRVYPLSGSDGKYHARFRLNPARLFSRNVMVTFGWARLGIAVSARLVRAGIRKSQENFASAR